MTTEATQEAAAAAAATNEFAALVAELDTLAKAMPAGDCDKDDDKKIEAAAADGGTAPEADPDKDGDEDEVLGKSFGVTLADGTEVEAYDGTEMLKALRTENDELRGKTGELLKGLQLTGQMVKQQGERIAAQGDLIKSLRGDIAKLASAGRGRAAVLSVHEKPTAEPAKPEGISPGDLMAKAMVAFEKNAITGLDVARLEARLGVGAQPPADIIAAIAAATA